MRLVCQFWLQTGIVVPVLSITETVLTTTPPILYCNLRLCMYLPKPKLISDSTWTQERGHEVT